jgi:hypothetical protein
MSSLGIYFGPKFISLVETEGQKVMNTVSIPLQKLSGTAIEEKIPEEIKIAAAIKDELRKNNIEAKEAGLVLLGRDLIIRTFHMQVLSPKDTYTAVRFEAKKYIPFRVEELVYDFQVSLDRVNKKNLVLFVGAKKEILDKYISIFAQLGIKMSSIEYAGFSVLRLLQLAKIKEKGVTAVVDIDLAEEDEVNFVVLENGMPLFSRDIMLSGDAVSADADQPEKLDLPGRLEKLKVELRISLDFYLRKFPTKNINSVIVIASEDSRQEIESFIRERGLEVKFADSRKFIDRPMAFSLGLFKAYAVNLKKIIKNKVVIDLLPNKIKARGQEQVAAIGQLIFGFKFDFRFILAACAIIGGSFGLNYYRLQPIQAQLSAVLAQRPQVTTVSADSSFEELSALNSRYMEKIKGINQILKKRMFVTGQLDTIPRVIPEGLWLRDFVFFKTGNDLMISIKGSCYLGESDKERKMINKFLNDLKENPAFAGDFKKMNILSLDEGKIANVTLTNFVIECRSQESE